MKVDGIDPQVLLAILVQVQRKQIRQSERSNTGLRASRNREERSGGRRREEEAARLLAEEAGRFNKAARERGSGVRLLVRRDERGCTLQLYDHNAKLLETAVPPEQLGDLTARLRNAAGIVLDQKS